MPSSGVSTLWSDGIADTFTRPTVSARSARLVSGQGAARGPSDRPSAARAGEERARPCGTAPSTVRGDDRLERLGRAAGAGEDRSCGERGGSGGAAGRVAVGGRALAAGRGRPAARRPAARDLGGRPAGGAGGG